MTAAEEADQRFREAIAERVGPRGLESVVGLHVVSIDDSRFAIPSVVSDLSNIRELSFVGAGVRRMQGLERLQRLERLDLRENELWTVRGAEWLTNLRSLCLDGNPILTLDPRAFASLRALENLSLRRTGVTNLFAVASALSGVSSLRRLAFQGDSPPVERTDEADAGGGMVLVMPVTAHAAMGTTPEATSLGALPHALEWNWQEHVGDFDFGEEDADLAAALFGDGEEERDAPDHTGAEPDGPLAAPTIAIPFHAGEESSEDGAEGTPEDEDEDEGESEEEDGEIVATEGGTPSPAVIPAAPPAPPAEPVVAAPARRSPVCSKALYREYLIASLPQLVELDGIAITAEEREHANQVVAEHFDTPPRAQMPMLLMYRELGLFGSAKSAAPAVSLLRRHGSDAGVRLDFSRAASASTVDVRRRVKFQPITPPPVGGRLPRQFEYSPNLSNEMIYGTMGGDAVLINHNTGAEIARIPSRLHGDVLALSWCRQSCHSRSFIAGTDQGQITFVDMSDPKSVWMKPCPTFERLTSVHVNSTDQQFLASGYSTDVSLFDISEGRLARQLRGLHAEHINVVKFSAESPFIFASSSFDKSIALWDLRQEREIYRRQSDAGNVMIMWSPDDRYLLSSAVDLEIRQWFAADGRLDRRFEIQQRQSATNYTRAYYASGGDYVIVGSCEENVVRVIGSQTGKMLCEVEVDPFDDPVTANFLYIQSLRGDPFNPFHLSTLIVFSGPVVTTVIAKTNLFGC